MAHFGVMAASSGPRTRALDERRSLELQRGASNSERWVLRGLHDPFVPHVKTQ